MDIIRDHKRLMMLSDYSKSHDDLINEHLLAIEAGSTFGLERIMGAILVTGSCRLQILCAEVYNRDCLQDPHVESTSAYPTSVPADGPVSRKSEDRSYD